MGQPAARASVSITILCTVEKLGVRNVEGLIF